MVESSTMALPGPAQRVVGEVRGRWRRLRWFWTRAACGRIEAALVLGLGATSFGFVVEATLVAAARVLEVSWDLPGAIAPIFGAMSFLAAMSASRSFEAPLLHTVAAVVAPAGILIGTATSLSSLAELFYVICMPSGLLLAFFWWSWLGRLRALQRAPTQEDHAVFREEAGRWLVTVAAVAAIALLLLEGSKGWTLLAVQGGLGAVLLGMSKLERWRLRRWLDHVREGLDPRWAIVDASAVPAGSEARARIVRTAALDGLLLRRHLEGPYREGSGEVVGRVGTGAPTRPTLELPQRALKRWCALTVAYFLPLAAFFLPFPMLPIALGYVHFAGWQFRERYPLFWLVALLGSWPLPILFMFSMSSC